jgi:hypothetical protein
LKPAAGKCSGLLGGEILKNALLCPGPRQRETVIVAGDVLPPATERSLEECLENATAAGVLHDAEPPFKEATDRFNIPGDNCRIGARKPLAPELAGAQVEYVSVQVQRDVKAEAPLFGDLELGLAFRRLALTRNKFRE